MDALQQRLQQVSHIKNWIKSIKQTFSKIDLSKLINVNKNGQSQMSRIHTDTQKINSRGKNQLINILNDFTELNEQI